MKKTYEFSRKGIKVYNYHLYPGDMFETPGGLGLIVGKKSGKFYYRVVNPAFGTVKDPTATSRIPTKSFYKCLDDGVVEAVYMTDRKYRRKRK